MHSVLRGVAIVTVVSVYTLGHLLLPLPRVTYFAHHARDTRRRWWSERCPCHSSITLLLLITVHGRRAPHRVAVPRAWGLFAGYMRRD